MRNRGQTGGRDREMGVRVQRRVSDEPWGLTEETEREKEVWRDAESGKCHCTGNGQR